jgi:hypothetical protein
MAIAYPQSLAKHSFVFDLLNEGKTDLLSKLYYIFHPFKAYTP